MASHPIYQFYAELKDYEPKIWRRFQVMNNITMARLGYIIMTMFEMQASHLFCFDVSGEENYRRYLENHGREFSDFDEQFFEEHPNLAQFRVELINDELFFETEENVKDAAIETVKRILDEENQKMTFSYDFGDGWEIVLTLEKILEDEAISGKELPRVLEGVGYGIIEDCGGPGGLEELAQAYKAKNGERYEEYQKWLGVDELDLETFDLSDMNFRLKKVPRIYRDCYEYGLEPTKQSMDLLTRKYKKGV